MLLLGIDGGGTKTEFALYDGNARQLAFVKTESAGHWQVSHEKMKEVLRCGLDSVMDAAGKKFSDITAAAFGMSGLGEDIIKDAASIAVCKELFIDIPIKICNDTEVGFVAAHGLKSGINVVAGTGSMSFGMDDKGNTARCGGWGHEIGDEGSGYWLGKKTLELFTKQSDGRLLKTYFYDLVKERLNITNDFDIMTIVQNEYYTNRTNMASLQMILCDAAKVGDRCAIDAYKCAANELIALAVTIREKLDYTQQVKVSYSGGIFNAGDFIRDPFIDGLKELGFEVYSPKFTPIQGAIILAAQQIGKQNEIIDKLTMAD